MTASASTPAHRGIGLRSAAALVAGNMIGAGVFTTSGFALADLGSPALVVLAWAVGGAIALCGALAYAGLAAELPGNGGEYLFLSRVVDPRVGFLAGWISLCAGFTAPIAIAAHGLEAYVEGAFGGAAPPGLLGATAIGLCGAVHAARRGAGLRLTDVAVGLKLTAIVGFIAIGAWVLLAGDGFAPSGTGAGAAHGTGGAAAGVAGIASTASSGAAGEAGFPVGAFAVTLVWISFAYSGWNAAVYVAGELREPERTLPRALALATVGVAFLYVALNAVFVHAAPVAALAGQAEVGAIAAEALGGSIARSLLSGVVALGLFTSISAMVMVGPRVTAQMAADGLLPRAFAASDREPRAAIALQVGLALAAFFVAELRALLDYVGFLLGLSASATVACLFHPTLRAGAAARVPGHPVIPAIFVVATLGSSAFLVQREPVAAAVGAATLALGGLAYTVMRRSGQSPATSTDRSVSSP